MKRYLVHAKRWDRGWELHIDGVGVTQTRRLSRAEAVVRDYIALDLGVAGDSFDVEIIPEVDGDVAKALEEARKATKDAEAAQERAASLHRGVVSKFRSRGLSGKEIAMVMGVSPQRVSQLSGRRGR